MSELDGYLWRSATGRVPPKKAVCVCGESIYDASDFWNHESDGSIKHEDGTPVRPAPDDK